MQFIVLGAGAIGCYMGGRLAATGQSVTLVGRARVLDPLAANGLRVTNQQGFDQTLRCPPLNLQPSLADAVASQQGVAPQDLVILVCTKTTATHSAAQKIAQGCPAGVTIVSMQNGVDNARRLRAVNPNATLLEGMVGFTVNWRGPHHVHCANPGALMVQRHDVSERMTPMFGQSAMAMTLADDMQAVLWGKLLLNLINPVNALVNLPIRAQLLQRECPEVLAALQSEALGVLRVADIRPAKVAAAAAAVIPKILRLPNWLFTRVAKGMLAMDANARTSMCDDLQSGRPTEIDDLCGAVVRLARQHGHFAPRNQRMCDLMHRHQPGQTWSSAQLRDTVL